VPGAQDAGATLPSDVTTQVPDAPEARSHEADTPPDGPDGPAGPGGGDGDGPDGEGGGEGAAEPRRRGWHTAVEWLGVLVVALIVAFLVRTYVVQTYYIPSPSMEPTLQVGDHILVLKAAYRFTTPAIGDIIVFKAPPAEHQSCEDPQVQDLVKRIIAVPSDTIRSVGNVIFVNGAPLKQPWSHTAMLGQKIPTQTIPPNQFYVMGDNRPESCDSRVWGTVPRANIIGKAIFVFWPPSHIKPL
jgi:signal peptidase I